jgi:hypothetical protein
MMDKFEPGKVYPGLSSDRVKVTYGTQNLESIIKSLIELDMSSTAKYNEDTNAKFKRG